ncbi:DUF2760 domain-containing protein [Lignipirellula cremea]|uniref:DUF2760 domain-containing protein n=1 Tax=Lignipirellula cremea TaxID=2528010 RepID=A0A518DYL8_9BACT|nr:DUF2760 domain-containing protein [Lignipirellula cremea]QDU96939.1 hypothetical protein Pla8534_47640 [Lignipirellula cremea]
MRMMVAFRAFFAALFNGETAARIDSALGAEPAAGLPPVEEKPKTPPPAPQPKRPARSEALTLLAALQREARFLDIVKEPLGDYSDAQIGAAARDVLRDCGKVLDRLFALEPILDQEEGDTCETPAKFDAGRYRVTGAVAGDPPYRGQLVHHGWQAAKCELPEWSGGQDSANVVAPVELEIK